MSKRVQFIGNTAAAMASVTGLQRELMVDTTNWVVVVHDGTTIGGHPLALASLTNAQVATEAVAGTMSAGDKTKLDQYPTYANPFVLARGTVGAVAYAFTSDTGTGMWSAGAGVVNFSSAGAEIVRINGTGVGIKQNNPAHVLDVIGDGSFTTNILFGTSIQFNAAPASAGVIRLANAQSINFRNAGNTADITAINVDASNIVNVGDATNTVTVKAISTTSFVARVNGINALTVDGSGNVTPAGGVNEVKVTLASAATVNIGGAAGNYINITGTTTITAFDNVAAGISRILHFTGSLTLTNNANIIVDGGANYVTAVDDKALAVSEGAGVWRVTVFPVSGKSVVSPTQFVKAWGIVNWNGSAYSIVASSGGASVSRSSAGVVVVTHGVTMSSANYVAIPVVTEASTTYAEVVIQVDTAAQTTTTVTIIIGLSPSAGASDQSFYYIIAG